MPKEARVRQETEWPDGLVEFRMLPQICSDLHMSFNGSADDTVHDDVFDLETLRIALKNWKEGREQDKLFDDAVRNLIAATIQERE